MNVHPEFGEVPTFASAKLERPVGWWALRVFRDGIELQGVVEVDTVAGRATVLTGKQHRGGWEEKKVTGKFTLEWMEGS